MDCDEARPVAAEAAAFRAAHGAPASWSADEFELYLELERASTTMPPGSEPA